MNADEFEKIVNSLTENEGAMSAICASDVRHVQTMYTLSSAEEIAAESAGDLLAKLNALAGEAYDAYIIVLRIPREALEAFARGIACKGKFALIGAVRSESYEAVIGCYKTQRRIAI